MAKLKRRLTNREVKEREIHYPEYAEIKDEVSILDERIRIASSSHIMTDVKVYALAFLLLIIGRCVSGFGEAGFGILFVIAGICVASWEYERFRDIRQIKRSWVKKRIGVEYVTVIKKLGEDEHGHPLVEVKDVSGKTHMVRALQEETGTCGIILYILGFNNHILYDVFSKREEPEKEDDTNEPEHADKQQHTGV